MVGNGPSLKTSDLTRLKGRISIASNKIYLAFNETPWRPDFYTVSDDIVWGKVKSEIHKHLKQVITPSDYGPAPGIRHFHFNQNSFPSNARVDGHAFSPDLRKGAFAGYTVTYTNLQLAVHLGLNPIYIIGCDHYYSGENPAASASLVTHDGSSNHFHPDYRKAGEVVNSAPVGEMNKAYGHAQAYASMHGISIFNATRGGHLNVFPRADLDAVLASLD